MIPVSILPATLHVHAGTLEWKHPMFAFESLLFKQTEPPDVMASGN